MQLILADDHAMFRDALSIYFERNQPETELFLADDFFEVEELLAHNEGIDLVILDFCMKGMDNGNSIRKLKEEYPDVLIAIISGVAHPADVDACIDAGAIGFFPKSLSAKALVHAIHLVMAGERFKPADYSLPDYLVKSQETIRALSDDNIDDIRLTPREKDVLSCLVTGASNKEIARDLDLQVVTVKLHVRSICSKMDVQNRTQAALKARDMGFQPKKDL